MVVGERVEIEVRRRACRGRRTPGPPIAGRSGRRCRRSRTRRWQPRFARRSTRHRPPSRALVGRRIRGPRRVSQTSSTQSSGRVETSSIPGYTWPIRPCRPVAAGTRMPAARIHRPMRSQAGSWCRSAGDRAELDAGAAEHVGHLRHGALAAVGQPFTGAERGVVHFLGAGCRSMHSTGAWPAVRWAAPSTR